MRENAALPVPDNQKSGAVIPQNTSQEQDKVSNGIQAAVSALRERGVTESGQKMENVLKNSTDGIAKKAAGIVGDKGDTGPLIRSNAEFISDSGNLITTEYINDYAEFFTNSLKGISSPMYERLQGKAEDLSGELVRFATGKEVSASIANDADFLSLSQQFQGKLNEAIKISQALHNLIYGKNAGLDAQVTQYTSGNKGVIENPVITDATTNVDISEIGGKIEAGNNTTAATEQSGGKVTAAFTNNNQEILTKYKVVDAKDLIVSNNLDGSVNSDYPQELQPRERTRASSAAQIQNIANNIVPEKLGESANVSDGAPIVGSDNVVESGNGRAMALRLMYQNNAEGAKRYIDFIKQNAEKFGVDISNLPAQPVLVRERLTDVNRAEFARQANESTLSAMSATELAQSDSKRMTDEVLDLLVPNDDGNLNTSDNKAFISAVIAKVFPNNDLNSVVSANGKLSANGLERITNAIFFKAYGDTSLAARLSESLDNDIKNITKVLLNIAPKIVKLKNGIQNGSYYDLDFSKNLVDAVDFMQTAKKEKLSVEELSQQTTLLKDVPEVTKAIACVFEQKNRGAKQATEFLNVILDVVMAEDPNQESLLQKEILTKEGAFDEARKQFNGRQDDGRREIKIPQGLVFQGRSELSQTDDGRGIGSGDRNDGFAHGDEQKETGSREVQRPAAKAEADRRTEGTASPGRGRGETASGLSRTNETEVEGRTAGGKSEKHQNKPLTLYDRNHIIEYRSPEADEILSRKQLTSDETNTLFSENLTPEIKEEAKKIKVYAKEHDTSLIDTIERKKYRVKVADEYYNTFQAKNKNREAVIIIGFPAAGKSTIAETICSDIGGMILDSDIIKEGDKKSGFLGIPEYNGGIGVSAVHEESTMIAKSVFDDYILANGDNLVYPKVGGEPDGIVRIIEQLKSNGYSVSLVLNDLPVEKAINRTISRFEKTGRLVSPEKLLNMIMVRLKHITL